MSHKAVLLLRAKQEQRDPSASRRRPGRPGQEELER